jgi:flavin-binding protein dodecin
MEDYERVEKDKRLIELINHAEKCAHAADVSGWLDSIPELAEICIFLSEETHDSKYIEILSTVITSIDDLIVDAIRRAPIEEKEQYNIFRLRLFRIMQKLK